MELTHCKYRLYGLTVDAPFPLPGAPLESVRGKPADVVVTWEGTWGREYRWQTIHPSEHQHQPEIGKTDAGEICLAWSGEDDGLLCVISADSTHIRLFCVPDHLIYAPAMMVGLVLGVLLQNRGILCLHGTAVAWKNRSLAILGPSGAGKSTLSAALVARGATLLTDDLLAIRQTPAGAAIEQGCLGIRLLPTSADRDLIAGRVDLGEPLQMGKHLWDLSGRASIADAALPLEAIYVLRPAAPEEGELAIHPLSPKDALRHLASNWYPPSMQNLMRPAAFAQIGDLACRVSVRSVIYGHRWDHLDTLAKSLLA